MTYASVLSFPGRLLYDIYSDKWTVGIFSGNSSAWVTYLELYKVAYIWPWKKEKSLSLLAALLQNYSFYLSLYTDWHGICSRRTIAAPISNWLFPFRLCCVY